MRHLKILLAAVIIIFSTSVLALDSSSETSASESEKKSADLNDFTLEDLLKIKVTVASGSKQKGLTTRESPSIVSVITADEIKKSGARDMLDILRMVPGFSIPSGADNSFTLTPGLRGLKAGEGKMLLQVNGFSFVDLSYVSVQVFNRFPVDQIKQVEIIRGPGSAIYGGNAELTVVNVELKDGGDLQGHHVNTFYSQMEKTYARRNLSYATGHKEGDYSYSLNTYFGNAELGDKNYTDEAGANYRFDERSGYDTRFINFNQTHKNLTTRILYADYSVENTDNYYATGDPYKIRFTNLAASVAYDYKAMDGRLILTPSLDYNRNGAWNVVEDWTRNTGNWNTDQFDQSHVKLNVFYQLTDNIDLIGGVVSQQNNSQMVNNQVTDKHIYYSSLGAYLQSTLKLGKFNLTAGGRYEENTVSDKSALVPRLAATGLFGKFHFKALYSQAYRTPSGTQYILQEDVLKPETATVNEVEIGYEVTSKSILTVNLFETKIDGALRYATSGYLNTTSSGSKGGEVEYKYVDSWGNVSSTISYYEATKRGNGNQISTLDEKAVLGMPRIKYTLAGTYSFNKDRSLHFDFVREEKLYAFKDSTFQEHELDPANIVNLYYLKQNAFKLTGFDIGFGIWNLLDSDIWFPTQERNGQPPPLPGPSREYGLRLAYAF